MRCLYLIFFFVEDAVIFCKAKEEGVQELMAVLQCYAEASGQVINREKSSLYFGSKCSRQKRRQIAICTNIQGKDENGKYLGINADFGASKNAVFEGVREALERRINGWAELFLSLAGKEVLIEVVAMALPNYAMLCSGKEGFQDRITVEGGGWAEYSNLSCPLASIASHV